MPTPIENFALRHVLTNSTIVSVERMREGISSLNYKIDPCQSGSETQRKSYVLTLFPDPSDWWKMEKEVYLRTVVENDPDVLIPQLIDTGEDKLDGQKVGFLLREFVEGNNLDETFEQKGSTELNTLDWQNLVEDFGFRLASLHVHRLGYFGIIIGSQLPVLKQTWRDFIENQLANEVSGISVCNQGRKFGLVTAQMISDLVPSLLDSLQDRFSSLETVSLPALVHGDMRFANVVAGRNDIFSPAIKSFIDWEWALSGDPEIDLAYAENWLQFSSYKDKFTNYGSNFIIGYRRKMEISGSYQEKRLIYHALRSLNYLRNVFLYQPDNFTSLDPRFASYVEGHFKIIESIAGGKELQDLGILPINLN